MTALVLGPGEGRSFTVGADRVVHKASSELDRFTVVEYLGAPVEGPPLHVHRSTEELFFILEGEVDFTVEGVTERMGVGGVAFVPRGKAHTFAVAGGRPARWVGIFSPGSHMALVEELGALIASGKADPTAVAALFARYDTDLVVAAS